MTEQLSLAGVWQLCTDHVPCQFDTPPANFPLTMQLPGTTSQQQIGEPNPDRIDGCLTDRYPFYGQIWLRKTVTLTPAQCRQKCFLHLERTRMTRLWVNGKAVGSENSLCTPHVYDLTGLLTEETELTICVKNVDYPTGGGHMTSCDTQTNWIGVTGGLELRFHAKTYVDGLRAFPQQDCVTLTGQLHGSQQVQAKITVQYEDAILAEKTTVLSAENGTWRVCIPLPADCPTWSEYTPRCLTATLELPEQETMTVDFGVRTFKACGDHFEINGQPVMLRGKHDGMVFPLTGAAPTDVAAWRDVFLLMKEWGINHYRFHTCCPPEAAFTAADEVGIYMEPELPFWGTVHALDDPECKPEEQAYLLREGLRICAAFGNHPSFCMFSLGNELWGSPERLGEIIRTLREADPRPLYTQGSNNFQHMPLQIPEEDFWTGVRTGKGKLIRGSYATCDAPLGMLQTAAPSANWDYEAYLMPQEPVTDVMETGSTEVEIQYGTGVKKVQAVAQQADFAPTIPVVTHEIGQYNVYPDYDEIPHYTGVLEPGNLAIFRERLAAAGMLEQAAQFFHSSGRFARDCYKQEIEAAMRTPHLAGFQILDLQDFPGQGTALVGMLNALLENKGFIEPAAWRGFCGDVVPLLRFDSYVMTVGEVQTVYPALRHSRPCLASQRMRWEVSWNGKTVEVRDLETPIHSDTPCWCPMPPEQLTADAVGKMTVTLSLPETGVSNSWDFYVLPKPVPVEAPAVTVVHTYTEAETLLQAGKAVLLLPNRIAEAVTGFYCTDFWNYHMFRIISESMGKEVPIGTMGLCMEETHPIIHAMLGQGYSTPQWYMPVTHADCAVLDAAPAGYRPILQMIDNVERNHRLGILFEGRVGQGRLLVCTVRFHEAPEDAAMNCLQHAVMDYVQSDAFQPETALSPEMLKQLFG